MKYMSLIVFVLLSSGCASFEEAYQLDQEFGVASSAAWEQQVANPEAGSEGQIPLGLEGITAEEIMGVYNGTFADEPMEQNVISLGIE